MLSFIIVFLAVVFYIEPAHAFGFGLIISAIVSAAASTAFASAASVAVAGGFFSYFAQRFLISAGLQLALNALAPKPRATAQQEPAQSAILVSGVSAIQDHQIIYGRTKIGGVIVYKEATDNNKFLHVVTALAGHECEEIETVYLNDEALTLDGDGEVTAPDKYAGKVRVNKHLGSTTQTADDDLVAESDGKWTSDHRLQGICYIYTRLEFDADAFPNGEPNMTALVKGKKVYNPSSGSTAWSANAALCLRDYITSDYGLNADSNEIDDTLLTTAATICDQDVTLSGGATEDRYTTNGAITTGSKPAETLDALLRCMGGVLWYAQGKWRVKAAAYITPSVTFTEDDLRSNVTIQTRHSRRDNFNIVRGTFRGEESNWQFSDFPQVKSATFIEADGGDESAMDLEMGLVASSATAQRIAKIALYQNREQLTVSASFGLRAMQVQVGDVVNFTNTRAGFTDKPFEVVNWVFAPDGNGNIIINMTLRETSSAVYDWSAEETAFEANNTVLADPFDVPPIGLNVSSEARIINEHLTNVIKATVTADAPERIDNVEVQFKKSTDSVFIAAGIGDLGEFEVIDVQDADYDVRARAINTFGIKGDFISRTNITVEGLSDPPADVSNFSFNVSSAGIHLEWDAVPDLDLSFYRIRFTPSETGATFANATTAVNKVARPANSVTVPPRSGTYMIKAYDKSGNQSAGAASVVIRAEDLDVFTNTLTQTEHTAFSGNKTGCSVVSNRLRITDPSSAPTTATYDFSNYIDTSSVRVARVNMDVKVLRVNDAATDTFDTLTGLFDSLPALFDDLTGGSSFADVDVVQFVSTTDDDPAGSPSWSAYKRFKSGDLSGRAFRFRVELQSTANDVTPAIEELAAKVRYN
jgi:hypothetical protein